MKRKDQNFILIKNEQTLSQGGKSISLFNVFDEEQVQKNVNAKIMEKVAFDDGLHKYINEECVEEEDMIDLSLSIEKSIIEINRGELAIIFSQGSAIKLLKVVKSEVGHAKGYDQHHGEILEESSKRG